MASFSRKDRSADRDDSAKDNAHGGTMLPPAFDEPESPLGGTARPESSAVESLDSPQISKTVDPRRLTQRDAHRLHTLVDTASTATPLASGPAEPKSSDTMQSPPPQLEAGPAPPSFAGLESPPTQDWGDTGESSGTWSHLVIQPRQLTRTDSAEYDTRPDYEVLDELGHGAMGVVYRARQASVNRIVAVKMLSPKFADDDHQRGLFLGEAVVTGELEHPNIVPIYDLAKSQGDALFYSMKEVKGTPWNKVIGEKSLSENLDVWLRVSDAIAFAHDRGVIHRDLKPENVMLGRFGEVLVMDWGIAVSRSLLQNPVIANSNGQGGTPAYMAPEMAKEGPLSRIGTPADIYLLGSLLYEIITGKAPHTGKDVFSCLINAAKNKIVPTDEQGELVEIALKAMATEPRDRYPRVEDLQAAVRGYLSHAESITLTERGRKDLASAEKTGDYNLYQQAILAFREAVALWPENHPAERELGKACEACARQALRRGDYDLGLSVLDADNPDHRGLIASLKAKRRRRRGVRALIVLLVAIIVLGSVVSAVTIGLSLKSAIAARQRAETEKQNALEAKGAAEAAQKRAEDANAREIEQKKKAVAASKEAVAASKKAVAASIEADSQRKLAVQAAENEKIAAQQAKDAQKLAEEKQQEAEHQTKIADAASYRAQIALAKSQIDANGFSRAKAELEIIKEKSDESRMFDKMPWEYRRLRYMLGLSKAILEIENPLPVYRIAMSPDGSSFAIAGQSKDVSIWSTADATRKDTIETRWGEVSTLEFMDGGRRLVTVSNGEILDGEPAFPTEIASWDTATWQSLDTQLSAKELRILAFAPLSDGGYITGSVSRSSAYTYSPFVPGIVQHWRPGQEPTKIVTHYDAVADVVVSPDEQTLVSLDQFGQAVVCRRNPAGEFVDFRHSQEQFAPHDKSSIHAAKFSPDGSLLATAAQDGRVLLWLTADLVDATKEYKDLQPVQSMPGHASAVLCLDFSSDGSRIVSGGNDGTVRVWDRVKGEQIALLRGHSNSVRACVFNPADANVIVSGDLDGEVRIWDLREYQEMLDLREEELPIINHASFSPDGQYLAVAHRAGIGHGATTLWKINQQADGRLTIGDTDPVVLSEGHTMPTCYAFAAAWGDEERLVTLAQDAARFWDISRGRQLESLRRVKIPMNFGNAAVALSQDANWIIAPTSGVFGAGLWNRSLWNENDNPEPRQHLAHTNKVEAVGISPSGRYLFSGDASRQSVLWRLNATEQSYEEYSRLPWGWQASGATAALFLPDESRVLAVDAYMVRQFDVATGKEFTEGRFGSSSQGKIASIALTPDAKTLVVATDNGWISAWNVSQPGAAAKLCELPPIKVKDASANVAAGEEPKLVDRVITSVAVSGDGRKVMDVSTADRSIRISNLTTTGQIEPRPAIFRLDKYSTCSASFYKADGSQIFSAGESEVVLWDVTGDEPQKLRTFGSAQVTNSVEFSSDGARVVTAHGDGQAVVWDLDKRIAHCHTAGRHRGGAQYAMFSRDGGSIYTAGADGRVNLWDADTGTLKREFCRHVSGQRINGLAISQDETRLVTAGDDGKVVVWNMQTGDLVYELEQRAEPVTCVAYSADSHWLIAGGAGRSAWIWPADRNQPVELKGHSKQINSVAFTPDGNRAVTSSEDGTAKLWVIRYETNEDGERIAVVEVTELLTFNEHDSEVVIAQLSPNRRNLLTASRNGHILIRPSVSE